MTNPLALIVDDRPADQLAVAGVARDEGWQVLFAEDFSSALNAFRQEVSLVICRGTIDGTSGIDFLRRWRIRQSDAQFLLLFDADQQPTARESIKAGAMGCLLGSLDLDELRTWVRRCRECHLAAERERELRVRLDERFGFEAIVGESKAMQIAVTQARAAAAAEGGVLLVGEPGTGKTLVAQVLHQNSSRAAGPFVSYAVSDNSARFVEQELFGTTNGSLRANLNPRSGLIQHAAGGTLLIHDVADLAAVTQARLLRLLDRRTANGAIAGSTTDSDVRIVAATSRRLDSLAADGRFSPALHRRLGENLVRLPPLRERREDIPHLVNYFLEQTSQHLRRPVPILEAELFRFLERFDWPGNVRQLKDCLESMSATVRKASLGLEDLPARIDDPTHDGAAMYFPSGMSLGELERSAVEQALAQAHGNRTRAADRLGISVRTLQRKLKSWSLEGIDAADRVKSD
jgi:DNA-binding NtrC family response regulator